MSRPDRSCGERVPSPPDGLTALERVVWAELAAHVEHVGTFRSHFFTSFRLMVQAVADARRWRRSNARSLMRRTAKRMLTDFGIKPERAAALVFQTSGLPVLR